VRIIYACLKLICGQKITEHDREMKGKAERDRSWDWL